jgi:hypothetical protein
MIFIILVIKYIMSIKITYSLSEWSQIFPRFFPIFSYNPLVILSVLDPRFLPTQEWQGSHSQFVIDSFVTHHALSP